MTLNKTADSIKCCFRGLDSLGPPVVLHVAEGSVGVVRGDVRVQSNSFGVAFYRAIKLIGIEIFVALILKVFITHSSAHFRHFETSFWLRAEWSIDWGYPYYISQTRTFVGKIDFIFFVEDNSYELPSNLLFSPQGRSPFTKHIAVIFNKRNQFHISISS